MSETQSGESWRNWSKGTTDRQGRERDLEDYLMFLGFTTEDLKGKMILDLGSGEREYFSRDLKRLVPDAKVYSLNPDYSEQRFRKTITSFSDWQGKSVAGLAQELPFKDNTFDMVLGLYSVTAFADPGKSNEAALRWADEVSRVLKPGGEAKLYPIANFSDESAEEVLTRPGWKDVFDQFRKNGLSVEVERIRNKDLGIEYSSSSHINDKGDDVVETTKNPEYSWAARVVVRKPAE